MPITKAAKKALKQSKSKAVINKRIKESLRKISRIVEDLIKAGKSADATKELGKLYKALDKAAKRNVIGKQTANRKKSRITKAINKAAKAPKKTEKKDTSTSSAQAEKK